MSDIGKAVKQEKSAVSSLQNFSFPLEFLMAMTNLKPYKRFENGNSLGARIIVQGV